MQAVKGTVRLISSCRDHQLGEEVAASMITSEREAMNAADAAAAGEVLALLFTI
jgi:hypothetical protein